MQMIARQTPTIHLPAGANDQAASRCVQFSVPFNADRSLPNANQWRLVGEVGPALLQARWLGADGVLPDHGTRWLHCEAIANASGDFALLTADDNPRADANTREGAGLHEATAEQSADHIILSNGPLALTLRPHDDQPLADLRFNGQRMLADHAMIVSYECDGHLFRSDVASERRAVVTATGPVRAVVDLHGRCVGPDNRPGLRYRLRFEVIANTPGLAISLWFFHDLPSLPELAIDALSLNINLRDATGQHHVRQLKYGLTEVPRAVTTDQPMDARVGHDGATRWRLADAAPLGDDTDYPSYQMPPLDEVDRWFGAVLDGGRWAAMSADDLDAMLPKGMRVADGAFTFDVWPAWSPTGPMVLPQGRSRCVTTRLAFGNDAASLDKTVDATFAATKPTTLLLPAEHYAQTDALGQSELLPRHAGNAKRFDGYLTRVGCPPTVADMFDLGDTPDPGYQRTYTATGRRVSPLVPDDQLQLIQYEAHGHHAVTPWSNIQQYEQVWANNEYDVIWAIASEAMRSRQTGLLTSLRWFARHAIEVDFVHHSDDRWKHRNTPPHCTGHTSAGGYPSHVWTEGMLGYYALTGDEDALAFARAIADKVLEFFTDPEQRAKLWKPTRELGWGLLAVAATAAFDRQPRYIDMSCDIANMLLATELNESFMDKVAAGAFGYASLSLGVDKLNNVCPDQRYRDWLVALAQAYAPYAAGERERRAGSLMGLCILHAGYKHCGEPALLHAGMHVVERFLDSKSWFDPQPYTKPLAMLHRPLSRFLKDAADAGLLAELDYRF